MRLTAATSIRLPEEVAVRLNHLVKLTRRSKTYYITEAMLRYMDDLEDLYLAEQRLIENRVGRSKTSTLEEVEKSLGLAD